RAASAMRALSLHDALPILASASLLVQRAVGVATEPVLVPRGAEGIVNVAEEGGLIVGGLSGRWRQEGLGETRVALAFKARPPALDRKSTRLNSSHEWISYA